MKKKNPTWAALKRFSRYFKIFLSQAFQNREYAYFLAIATVMDIGLMTIVHPLGWLLIGLFNLFIGLVAIGSVVRKIEKAFETLGLDFEKGFGPPRWLVDGKYPASQEIIRINGAGYGPADYVKCLDHLAARLNQPIKEIRKPAPNLPVLEVVLKPSHLLDLLRFSDLPIGELKPGEFFVGKTDDAFEKLSLKQMVHMLVAGQTGSGKTQFLRQFMATVLTHCRDSFVALIDMKGGIDFQAFLDVPNFRLVSKYTDAEALLAEVIRLFEIRRELLLLKKKTNWSELKSNDLEHEPSLTGLPIGPVVVVVDELAELSKKATERSAKSPLQEQLATLARLARFAGIHLVLGTQRPDKSTLDMQSKDNLPTRVCFSVPSVTASTLVVGDMSASTLGNIPGRAIFQLSGTKVLQTPLIENPELSELIDNHSARLTEQGYSRRLGKDLKTGAITLTKGPMQ